MARKIFHNLRLEDYQHPFDRKALQALEKMPGLSLLLKKISEYGIDRLLRLQSIGCEFQVNSRNFPKLYHALVESCQILEVESLPSLYLYRGRGHIATYAIGVEKPIIGVNLEAMEWLSKEELLFVLGHEVARLKGGYLSYYQLAVVMPLLKNLISVTTLGLGGLAANGIEVTLYNWIVMAKFTADRAALLSCQDVNVAITALMKLGGLPSEYLNPEVIEDFLQQARQFKVEDQDRLEQVTKFLSFMEYQNSWIIMRASELLKWVDTGMYAQWMRSDNPEELRDSEKPDETNKSEDSKDWDFFNSW